MVIFFLLLCWAGFELPLLSELDKERPTKVKIKAAIVKVARWKSLAEVLRTEDNLEKMESMEEELGRLMLGLGAKIKTPPASKDKRRKPLALKVGVAH